MDKIIYGSDPTPNIVNVSAKNGKIYVFTEDASGVKGQEFGYRPWVIASEKINDKFIELDGDNHYKYARFFPNERSWRQWRKQNREITDFWCPASMVNQYLLTTGRTYFKDTKRKDVSILCFDIETTGLTHDEKSKVLIIANTYRKGDTIIRKMFSLDEYKHQGEMLEDWSAWVCAMDPSILATYNGFKFDIPYMNFCAMKFNTTLQIGRDGSPLTFNLYESKFRQDQNRQIAYNMPNVFGRECLDLFFVVQKWDIGKKFSRYSLKSVIKEAGLERDERVMVDASKIWKYWEERRSKPQMWQQVKEYAEHDGDDTLAIYDLVSDAYFYSSTIIPFTYERMCLSASGAQLNSLVLRHYIAEGKTIPKPTDKKKYQGAISFGIPGNYRNVWKIDVASLYPSIIDSYDLHDPKKDPDKILVYMNRFFRTERLKYKKLAKETGDEFYAAMDAVMKANVNSIYGFTGGSGTHFNAPQIAEEVTRRGREILIQAMDWAKDKGFEITNGDTDSISFIIPITSKDYRKELLDEVNGIMRQGIVFDDDGFFPSFVVLKAKNYVMLTEEGKIKLKGSALKSSKIEPFFKAFQKDCIESLLGITSKTLCDVYKEYAIKLTQLTTIAELGSKLTISEKTVKSTRKNEKLVIEALEGTPYQLGDKFEFYRTKNNTLKLVSKFDPNNPDHNVLKLLGKLYKSSQTFATVDKNPKVNYGLTTNARKFNDMGRKKVLTEKPKKPSNKNALKELLHLAETGEINFLDDYGKERFNELLTQVKVLLEPKPKKPRKNSVQESVATEIQD